MSRHRTVTPDPGLVTPESLMEASRSAGVLGTGGSWGSSHTRDSWIVLAIGILRWYKQYRYWGSR